MSPVHSGAGNSAVAKIPFLFGAARASALPGPLLVGLMVELGGSPAAAKGVLHRMVTHDQLSLTRHGRVGVYRLAGQLLGGVVAIRDGAFPPSIRWDGTFHLLVHEVPEKKRALRDAIRTAAHRHGYRQLRPGVLISPYDNSAALADMLVNANAVTGRWEIPADEVPAVLTRTFRLDALADRYRAVAEHMRQLAATSRVGAEALLASYEASQEAYQLVMSDRALPREWLGADWPLADLQSALAALQEAVMPEIARHIDQAARESGYADLVEHDHGWDVSPPAGQS